jgi:hypothetical protein
MPAKKNKRRPWAAGDKSTIRQLGGRVPAPTIAKRLKRTESAVRQMACEIGKSLRMPPAGKKRQAA